MTVPILSAIGNINRDMDRHNLRSRYFSCVAIWIEKTFATDALLMCASALKALLNLGIVVARIDS